MDSFKSAASTYVPQFRQGLTTAFINHCIAVERQFKNDRNLEQEIDYSYEVYQQKNTDQLEIFDDQKMAVIKE